MRLDLGIDFYCAEDVSRDLRVERDGRAVYAQAMYRRLLLSSLFYSEGGYGVGVARWLLSTQLTDQQVQDAIRTDLMRDERTQSVSVNVSAATIEVRCTPHASQDFPLTLTIDRVKGALINGTIG